MVDDDGDEIPEKDREAFFKKINKDSEALKSLMKQFRGGVRKLGYESMNGIALIESSHHKLDTILFLMESIEADMQDIYAFKDGNRDFN